MKNPAGIVFRKFKLDKEKRNIILFIINEQTERTVVWPWHSG